MLWVSYLKNGHQLFVQGRNFIYVDKEAMFRTVHLLRRVKCQALHMASVQYASSMRTGRCTTSGLYCKKNAERKNSNSGANSDKYRYTTSTTHAKSIR